MKTSCLIKKSKNYRGGFVPTEPYQRDQVRYQESCFVRQLFHNGPVMELRTG